MNRFPSIALFEHESVAVGVTVADAMVKRATLPLLRCGTVQPGHFLILIGGPEGEVEEAIAAGRERSGAVLLDFVHLPHIHPALFEALRGHRRRIAGTSLAIFETRTVAAAIRAADAALKGVPVTLTELRLADGLGGKGLFFLSGHLADIEAAVEIGLGALQYADELVAVQIIANLHPDLSAELNVTSHFHHRSVVHGGQDSEEE